MQFIALPAGNRFKLVAYRISYGDFAVLCAKIGVETIMTDNVGLMSIGTLICALRLTRI